MLRLLLGYVGGALLGCGEALYPEAPPPGTADPETVQAHTAAEPDREAVPSRLGTPETSRGAAPAWFSSRKLWGVGDEPGYAPQGSYALRAALWARADLHGEAARLDQALLVCRFEVGSYRDGNVWEQAFLPGTSRADLVVLADLGPYRMYAAGEGESARVEVTFPLLGLERGQALKAVIADHDVLRFDELERFDLSYPGKLPWRIEGQRVQGECRGVSRQVVESQLVEQLRRADTELARAARCAPDQHDLRFGRSCLDGAGSSPVYAALANPAALVGWDDPRVRPRAQRADAVFEGFERAVEARLKELQFGVTPPVKVADGQLQVVRATRACSLARELRALDAQPDERCPVLVELKNTGSNPLQVDFEQLGPLGALDFVDRRGDRRPARVVGQDSGGKWQRLERGQNLGPGAGVTLVIAGPREPGAVFLRGERESSVVGLDTSTPVDLGEILEISAFKLRCGDAVAAALRPLVAFHHRETAEGSRCELRGTLRNLTGKAESFRSGSFAGIRSLSLIERGAVPTHTGTRHHELLPVARVVAGGRLVQLHWSGGDEHALPAGEPVELVFLVASDGFHQRAPTVAGYSLLARFHETTRAYVRVSEAD